MSVAVAIDRAGAVVSERADQLDMSLIRRMARREEAALTELVKQHGDGLRQLIERLTAWDGHGDDILQDVLLAAWQQAGTYRGTGTVDAWLRSIAINRCRNHHRTQRAMSLLCRQLAWIRGDNLPRAVDEDSGKQEAYSRIESELKRLSADDRALIVLYYLEELPSEEIARALSIRVETLHVRLHRARTRLRNLVEMNDE